jgi:hypothetical protein
MPDTIDKALNMAIIAMNAEKEDGASQRQNREVNKRVIVLGGGYEKTLHRKSDRPRGKIQWSGKRGDYSHGAAGHSSRYRRVDGTRSRRTDSRISTGRCQWPPIEGGAASGPKNGEDRYTPRPQSIQCYNCGLTGHTRECPRGQNGNPNGIGRTNTTPSSYPK